MSVGRKRSGMAGLASGAPIGMFAGGPAGAAEPRTRFDPVATAEACPGDRSPILILGTYHMSNPGLDTVNLDADDVLSARRQLEIEELTTRLAGFRPTKVFVESAYADRAELQERYARYLAGDYTLGRNEIDQIAFRLARRVRASVTPVDFRMFMSGATHDEVDSSLPRATPPTPTRPVEPSEEDLRLRRATVAEYLAYLNQPGRWTVDHLGYMDHLEPDPNSPALYAGADRLTNWYKRNFRIWANVVRTTDRPRDRALLLIGSGHLGILRQLAQDMPGFCLVEPAR